jgi:hypothetical protein
VKVLEAVQRADQPGCDLRACRKCGCVKPLAEFFADRTKKSGHQSACKACERPGRRANAKRYYESHAGQVKERVAARKQPVTETAAPGRQHPLNFDKGACDGD